MIYFVEDDADIRKLVCYALKKEGYDICGFELPSEFWDEIKKEIPQLILLDIMLPEEDGLSILSKLKADTELKNIPVIMITAKVSEFDKVTGLDMGADDYISKPFGITEMISRVRAVMRRYEKTKSYKSETDREYKIGNLYVNPGKHIVKVCGDEVALSFKEYSLLIALLEADGNVVTRDDLFTRVWGENYYETRTLDVHIRKLRVKLGTSGDLIQTVKNVGYKIGGNVNVQ